MNEISIAAAEQNARKVLMSIGARTLTYGDQWSRLHAVSDWIQQHGLADDSPILLAVGDEFEQASLLLALIVLGKPPLIIDPGSTAVEASVILANSEFSAFISDAALEESWGLDQLSLPNLRVAAAEAAKGVFGALLKNRKATLDVSTWPDLVRQNPTAFQVDAAAESLAYVMFTSGTTSVPKGVEITRGALESQLSVLVRQYSLDSNSRLLNTLPLHHADGLLQGPLLAWFCGGSVFRPIAFSTQAMQQYLDSIYRDRISHFIAVPTMLSLMDRFGQQCAQSFEDEGFQMIVSCAAHLEQPLWERLESNFAVKIVNMYGLTETGTSAFFSGPDGETRRVGTIGKAVNSRVRVVDDEGVDVRPGQPGELLISSDQLMRGYHNDEKATADIIRDGWLHTGDLGEELESGHFRIVGRKKNQIISGGRNISPEEIVSCLNQHPNVVEAIVFGQPEEDWGEKVVALVVADKAGCGETELTEWCRSHLSDYKVPRHIRLVDRLEKGPSGKIRTEAARRLFESEASKTNKPLNNTNDVGSRVLKLAADTFRLQEEDLNANSGIENTAGWDSLGHLSLLLAAETAFSIRFSPREIMQIDSIGKLITMCSEKTEA